MARAFLDLGDVLTDFQPSTMSVQQNPALDDAWVDTLERPRPSIDLSVRVLICRRCAAVVPRSLVAVNRHVQFHDEQMEVINQIHRRLAQLKREAQR